jgi:hypothetical protein
MALGLEKFHRENTKERKHEKRGSQKRGYEWTRIVSCFRSFVFSRWNFWLTRTGHESLRNYPQRGCSDVVLAWVGLLCSPGREWPKPGTLPPAGQTP